MKLKDLTNQKFGKWTPTRHVCLGVRSKWLCLCDCGTERLIWAADLKLGRTTNCGCVRRTHGMTESREFNTWHSMRKRCSNPAQPGFHRYGGRGITVCDRWLTSFENFYADMGPKPHGAQLDRIDNDGPYSPDNCRWVTAKQNGNNRGNNRRLTYNGETKTISEWSAAVGGHGYLVGLRLKQGWPLDRAVTAPSDKKRTPRRWLKA